MRLHNARILNCPCAKRCNVGSLKIILLDPRGSESDEKVHFSLRTTQWPSSFQSKVLVVCVSYEAQNLVSRDELYSQSCFIPRPAILFPKQCNANKTGFPLTVPGPIMLSSPVSLSPCPRLLSKQSFAIGASTLGETKPAILRANTPYKDNTWLSPQVYYCLEFVLILFTPFHHAKLQTYIHGLSTSLGCTIYGALQLPPNLLKS